MKKLSRLFTISLAAFAANSSVAAADFSPTPGYSSAFDLKNSKTVIEVVSNEKKPYEVVLSRQSHNRIAWEGSAVESVTGDPRFFTVEINSKIGQAFVHVIQDIAGAPKSLTIVSASGIVQDLLVLSAEKPSTLVAIEDPKEPEEDLSSPYTENYTQAVAFLNDLLDDRVPFGYGRRPIKEADKMDLPSPLEVFPLKAVDGPFETVVIYRITNQGKASISLSPEVLKRSGDSWVFLPRREVGSLESITCILARPKEEAE